MSSIALFPCLSDLESGIIGEMSNVLTLNVFTDDNLFEETANQFGESPARLKAMMYKKTSVFNQFTLEKEKAINMFRLILAEKLSGPRQYLFYGFLTSLIPAEVTEVLKVLVIDQKEQRIEHFIQQGMNPGEAKKKIRNHDISTFRWTDFLFAKEAYDSSLYDLVIPIGAKNHRDITKEIFSCFHRTSVLRTTSSQNAVRDMEMVADIEFLLLSKGHKLKVEAQNARVTVTIQNSVFKQNDLKKEITELVQQVDGVRDISFKKHKSYVDSVYRQQKFELPSKVLFVDDEHEFVQTVSQRLISRNVGTFGVYNGKEALDLILEDHPDVMVLDLKMPGLHGIEVLRQTKQLLPEIEVIILTGHGTTRDMEECMSLGAFAYLNKPVNIDELSATITAANNKVHGAKTVELAC